MSGLSIWTAGCGFGWRTPARQISGLRGITPSPARPVGGLEPEALSIPRRAMTGRQAFPQRMAALWSGYQTISKKDLNELGFDRVQSELLYTTKDNVCVGGFCLAGGVIQDWPLMQSSEHVAPLIGEKYLAVDIIVADDYRRKGLADYMVRKIVRSYGPLRHLMWNAETDNTASLKLAKRYGFVEFATTKDTDGGTTIHLIRKAGGR